MKGVAECREQDDPEQDLTFQRSWRGTYLIFAGVDWLQEIPFASPWVDEDRNPSRTTRSGAALRKRHSARAHCCIICLEIIGEKEVTRPARRSDRRFCSRCRLSPGTARTIVAPAPPDGATTTQRLSPPRGNVLGDGEAERSLEESQALVVVRDEKRRLRRGFLSCRSLSAHVVQPLGDVDTAGTDESSQRPSIRERSGQAGDRGRRRERQARNRRARSARRC